MSTIAIIGGSGLYELDGLTFVQEHSAETPFGLPSGPVREMSASNHKILFLPRHGKGHHLSPTEVPYAANILALKELGAHAILSISAVGGLREQFGPGTIVMPDQFIDRTTRRTNTFFGSGMVGHAALAEPVHLSWLDFVHCSAAKVDQGVNRGGTYICIEGPQFSTRAESNLYRSWNCDVIGMTNATEAKLAAEAGLAYCSLCFVTDYDCWKKDEEPVAVEQILAVLNANVEKGKQIVAQVVSDLDKLPELELPDPSLTVVTHPDTIDAAVSERMSPVLRSAI